MSRDHAGTSNSTDIRVTRLAFDRIDCVRGGRLLFEDLNFALGPGDALLVRGPNGAGKSSLLRIAAGLLKPAAGTIVRDGAVALAVEAHALDEDSDLAAALGFWAQLDGQNLAAVEAGLDALGLAALADVPVRLLSTGQRRRATLAGLVAGGAPIWLLDEPGNGLDKDAVDRWAAVMNEHLAGGGIILAASHQPLGIDARELVL